MKFPKVFGVNFPRTGGQSLRVALGRLGYSTDQALDDLDALSNVDACTEVLIDIRTLYDRFPDAAYVWLDRDIVSWRRSVNAMDDKFRAQSRNRAFWLLSLDNQTVWFCQTLVLFLKIIPSAKRLILNLRDVNAKRRLCEFLVLEPFSESFPWFDAYTDWKLPFPPERGQ